MRVALEAAGHRIVESVTGEARPDLAGPLPGNVAGFALDLAAAAPGALARMEATLAAAPASALAAPEWLSIRLDGDGPRIDLGRNGISVRKALGECRAALARVAPSESARGMRFIAGVEGLADGKLTGWAVDLLNPRASLALRLEAQGPVCCGDPDPRASRRHRRGARRQRCGLLARSRGAGAGRGAGACRSAGRRRMEAPAPSRLVALRLEADGSLIDLGAFGVSVGDILRALGAAPPAPPPAVAPAPPAPPRPARQGRGARLAARPSRRRRARRPPGAPLRRAAARRHRARRTVSAEVKRHAAEIAPLFDPFHYLDQLAAPEEATANPLLHYALAGWRDGASPFAAVRARALPAPARRDLRRPAAGFRARGRGGVDPHPLFDVAFYRARHLGGDGGVNPLAHYLETGGTQRLDPSPLFDTRRFLDAFGLGDETEIALEAYRVDAGVPRISRSRRRSIPRSIAIRSRSSAASG